MLKPSKLVVSGLALVAVLLAVAFGFNWWTNQSRSSEAVLKDLTHASRDHQLTSISVGERTLSVEVVNQPASITQGLSDRDTIGADGMLFILGEDEPAQFWMIKMKFSLDMIWIRDGAVVSVTENVPHPSPGTLPQNLPLYSADQVVDMVLEVPAGKASEWGITAGDEITVLE